MELKTTLQKRVAYQPTGLMMREESEQDPKIAGVAIVTNAETILYEGSDWREVEIIDPACISEEFIKTQDIKLNLLHERSLSFARCNKGEGGLSLDTREDGLHFETNIPDCDLGQRAKALIANGTYTGCSFEFYPKDYEVSERKGADGKNEYVIRHTAFAQIGAITIGMDPAYQQTSCGLRELLHKEDDADAEREAQLKAEAEKREQEKKTRERKLREMQMDWDAEALID